MKIALLTWGRSLERDISIKSARNFEKLLKEAFDYIDFYILPEDFNNFLIKINTYDLIIPIIHGIDWEDGKIFALLEFFDKKYLFSDYKTHLYSLDKFVSNKLLKDIIEIPSFWLIIKDNIFWYLRTDLGVKLEYNYIISFDKLSFSIFENSLPYVIKPRFGGSSIDTMIVKNKEDIQKSIDLIEKILLYDDVVVQKYISWDEISVWIFWDRKYWYEILWLTHIISENEFFDYDAKYKGKSKEIDYVWNDVYKFYNKFDLIKTYIESILEVFPIKTFARIDFLIDRDKDEIYFLEINTIPWFTDNSILPRQFFKRYWNWQKLIDYIEEIRKN